MSKCEFCGNEATLLCDMPAKKIVHHARGLGFSTTALTCDKKICVDCTTRIRGFDFCLVFAENKGGPERDGGIGMDRLTIPDEKIDGGWRRTVVDARAVKENAMTLYWQLKKYEDTGLAPERIRAIDQAYANQSLWGIREMRSRAYCCGCRVKWMRILKYMRYTDSVGKGHGR